MITVYGRKTSSNVQAVMWAIGELGLAHERLDHGHVHGGTDTPAFRAMNPNGLVPVIRDGDLVIWESGAILRSLAARYGDGGAFWPADPVARAVAHFETRLEILEGQLAGRDFVVSDDFTLADILIGHVLFRWFDIDIARKPRPGVEAYHQRLTERPAYREHVMVSYAPLRVEGA